MASGLNVTGGGGGAAVMLVGVFGTVSGAGASALATVSVGAGAGLEEELQPGLAKIRTRANTWIPTTMPKILTIFIGIKDDVLSRS
jgi:hypothetical protein